MNHINTINWQHDPVINKLAALLPLPEPYAYKDTYLFLIDSVISQQLSTKVAGVIYERFLTLFPDNYPYPEFLLTTPIETLRSVGLSVNKANYIQQIARFHQVHLLNYEHLQALPDEEVLALLTQIKGVGHWTAQMVMMFPLDRPDIFPIDDLAIRQQMIKWYNITETGKTLRLQLITIAENWRPHRSLACKYLWKSKELSTLNG